MCLQVLMGEMARHQVTTAVVLQVLLLSSGSVYATYLDNGEPLTARQICQMGVVYASTSTASAAYNNLLLPCTTHA